MKRTNGPQEVEEMSTGIGASTAQRHTWRQLVTNSFTRAVSLLFTDVTCTCEGCAGKALEHLLAKKRQREPTAAVRTLR